MRCGSSVGGAFLIIDAVDVVMWVMYRKCGSDSVQHFSMVVVFVSVCVCVCG